MPVPQTRPRKNGYDLARLMNFAYASPVTARSASWVLMVAPPPTTMKLSR